MSKKLLIEGVHKVHYIPLSNIIFCEADNNWTKIYTIGPKTHEVCQTLKQIEERINSEEFFRTHRKYLVNLFFVQEVKRDYAFLIMHEDYIVRVSRRKKALFTQAIKNFVEIC